jgi:tRNA-dihydrouridine synthase B
MGNQFAWNMVKKPIVALSPMDGVTDYPWRKIAKKYGQPDITYTEFVSVDGLVRIAMRGEWDHKIWRDLKFDDVDRPVIAQIFGSDPEMFYWATRIVCLLGFDGVDINMGCPSPGLERRGGGAGLIRRPELAKEIVEMVNKAVEDHALGQLPESKYMDVVRRVEGVFEISDIKKTTIPVTLKTRLGSQKLEPEWWKWVANLPVVTVAMHGRTFRQLYSGQADWDALLEAAKIVRSTGKLFLANGDVSETSVDQNWVVGLNDGKKLIDPEIDGILIGRGSMGRPWVLRTDGKVPDLTERLAIMVEHSREFEKHNTNKHFFAMRKHLVAYVNGLEGAGELRKALVMTNSSDEVSRVVDIYKSSCI